MLLLSQSLVQPQAAVAAACTMTPARSLLRAQDSTGLGSNCPDLLPVASHPQHHRHYHRRCCRRCLLLLIFPPHSRAQGFDWVKIWLKHQHQPSAVPQPPSPSPSPSTPKARSLSLWLAQFWQGWFRGLGFSGFAGHRVTGTATGLCRRNRRCSKAQFLQLSLSHG